MRKEKEPFIPSSPTIREIAGYIQAEIYKRIRWNEVGKSLLQASLYAGIGDGCPEYPLYVCIKSPFLDAYVARILSDIGIPDALTIPNNSENTDEPYLSVSGKSLLDFGNAHRGKILEWVAQQKATAEAVIEGGAA